MPVSQQILTFDRLTSGQRAVAWAVVRSLATALWAGVTAMGFVWILVAANRTTVALWSLPMVVGAIGVALVMEVKSRDLEKVRGVVGSGADGSPVIDPDYTPPSRF
jgi:hypothetical protein